MSSVSFLFWNLYGRQKEKQAVRAAAIQESIVRLATLHSLDAMLFAEAGAIDPRGLVASLNGSGVGTYYQVRGRSQRILFFSRLSGNPWRELFYDRIHDRLSVQRLLVGRRNILVAGVHLRDRMSISTEGGRADQARKVAADLASVEKEAGHARTVLMGDFNMNPFELGMVEASGMHALLSQDLAQTVPQLAERAGYPCFYNPSWRFFGGQRGSPPGTYFYENTQDATNHFWNVYDQVLIRPKLMTTFVDLHVLASDGQEELVTAEGRPKKLKYSDHLPILLQLTI